ncbi:MAG TPA: hypothetical protein VFH01_08690, partial [Pyrinomonadaceae bacterium]|nr:hypothetical protein [Pyrinomonadaceae bacterium]
GYNSSHNRQQSPQKLNLSKFIVTALTLKALANLSPGLALKPWVHESPKEILRNSEGVARGFFMIAVDATPFGLRLTNVCYYFPGLPERNPGLKLANAFNVQFDSSAAENTNTNTSAKAPASAPTQGREVGLSAFSRSDATGSFSQTM